MKKFLLLLTTATMLYSCGDQGRGHLIGVQGREIWYQPDPFGMLFIPGGSYNMGNNDQDVPYAHVTQSKTVTVQAFWMDETEITNNEYRQFVEWVKDSIARRLLGEVDEEFLIMEDEYGEPFEPPFLNWDKKLRWDSKEEEVREVLAEMYLPEHERYYRRKEIDTRKLNFEYYWIDYKSAASHANRQQGMIDRSQFIIKRVDNIYPDTLAWIRDFTYAYNEPMAQNYFWHPAYDHYPVVGVNWLQARAFTVWRTQLLNDYLITREQTIVNDFRLPTESEWEWAARGGLDLSSFPWGSPYIRNSDGCFLGNYKPLRGNYADDGGFHTVVVGHYAPNDFGLYDMAGNVSEWTSNAYDESAYNFAHDLNMDYTFEAKDTDPAVLKRKVIRGGSWKDIGYFMQVGTRTYEYQDTAKCYVGFRCAQTYLGRQKGDGPNSSNVY
ncbi:MAG: SUMF1/EgtB/PvdO family nonheme iron enzyme [Bacteroidales bacterium]|nr:SUMF1/EgtB/PvdO family nonheme iron enzyme [Bacteroidales bacterium]